MNKEPRRDEKGRLYYTLRKGGQEIRLERQEDENGMVYYSAPVTFGGENDDK